MSKVEDSVLSTRCASSAGVPSPHGIGNAPVWHQTWGFAAIAVAGALISFFVTQPEGGLTHHGFAREGGRIVATVSWGALHSGDMVRAILGWVPAFLAWFVCQCFCIHALCSACLAAPGGPFHVLLRRVAALSLVGVPGPVYYSQECVTLFLGAMPGLAALASIPVGNAGGGALLVYVMAHLAGAAAVGTHALRRLWPVGKLAAIGVVCAALAALCVAVQWAGDDTLGLMAGLQAAFTLCHALMLACAIRETYALSGTKAVAIATVPVLAMLWCTHAKLAVYLQPGGPPVPP